MIYLKAFNEDNRSLEELCRIYIDGNQSNKVGTGGLTYSIDNGYVNVDCGNGNLSLDLYKEDKIPIKFGKVNGSLFLRGSILSLENSPRIITYAFNIMSCRNLTSLRGGPDSVGGFYHCGSIPLDSISGLARPISEKYTLTTSSSFGYFHNVLKLFLNPKIEYSGKVKHGEFIIDDDTDDLVELFSYYDPLNGDIIYLDKLNAFLEDIGKKPVTSVYGYICK